MLGNNFADPQEFISCKTQVCRGRIYSLNVVNTNRFQVMVHLLNFIAIWTKIQGLNRLVQHCSNITRNWFVEFEVGNGKILWLRKVTSNSWHNSRKPYKRGFQANKESNLEGILDTVLGPIFDTWMYERSVCFCRCKYSRLPHHLKNPLGSLNITCQCKMTHQNPSLWIKLWYMIVVQRRKFIDSIIFGPEWEIAAQYTFSLWFPDANSILCQISVSGTKVFLRKENRNLRDVRKLQ